MLGKEEIQNYNKWLSSHDKEFLQQKSKEELVEAERDFKKFKYFLKKICVIYANKKYLIFQQKTIKFVFIDFLTQKVLKKTFSIIIQKKKKGYYAIDSYLRWVANTERPIVNINNLVLEKSSNKEIEHTIKYIS